MVVELKWDQSAETAISLIKKEQYGKALEGFRGDILPAGISYDNTSKAHACIIERAKN